jgi:hypothetical protein
MSAQSQQASRADPKKDEKRSLVVADFSPADQVARATGDPRSTSLIRIGEVAAFLVVAVLITGLLIFNNSLSRLTRSLRVLRDRP